MGMDKTAAIGTMDAGEATQSIQAPAANATQMAMNVECPVCQTPNPPSEPYCIDCGFLLSGAHVGVAEMPDKPTTGRLVTPDGTREFPLSSGENSVGRENADVLLAHNTVSRRHATVAVEDGRALVEDAGSTNGTYIDGKKLSPGERAELADGCDVVFGSFSLRYEAPAEDEEERGESVDVAVEQADAPREVCGEGEEPAVPVESNPAVPESADFPELLAQEPVAPIGYLAAKDGSCRFEIHDGMNTIGRRADDNDIDIPDPYCSGRHADLRYEGGRFTITDIGSTNGTSVNGVNLDANVPRELVANDEITLGRMTFVLEVA